MPCDDGLNNRNVLEYKDILNNIVSLCQSTNATMLCVGGDFNTDINRNSPQTQVFNDFCTDHDMFCCARMENLDFNFTYLSKINGHQSFIDHFVISDNLRDKVLNFESIDNIKNPSDHIAIKCYLDLSIYYNAPSLNTSHIERPVWDSVSDVDLNHYKECLNNLLLSIPIPTELLECNNNMCKNHSNEISEFHDNIVWALITACSNSIPVSKCKSNAKVIPGWNDNVEHYFRVALFWHNQWVSNGRPEEGIFATIRRETRAQYHKARKFVIKNKDIIQSEKLAESLANDLPKVFWKNVKKNRKNNKSLPSKVDDMQDPQSISGLFKDKFDTLFNSVSYDNDELNILLDDINSSINNSCNDSNTNNNNVLIFNPNNVNKAINKLKAGKTDGSLTLTSDNLLHSTDILNGHLALLFSVMVRHGFSPEGMLIGTMVPIPKGRWNLNNSNNYRAITISSLLGKILDNLILEKEDKNLITNDLQFSFKPGTSTTMCSTMVRETISYFVHKNSNVYGLVLDATKAFDRVNYCKLFKILLKRNVNPLICRLLLFMYINQNLRVRWGNNYSDSFTVSNGVKQGGVISPIFFVYIWMA